MFQVRNNLHEVLTLACLKSVQSLATPKIFPAFFGQGLSINKYLSSHINTIFKRTCQSKEVAKILKEITVQSSCYLNIQYFILAILTPATPSYILPR